MMNKYLFAVLFTTLVVIIGKLKGGICAAALFLAALLYTDQYTIIVFTITSIVLYFLLTVFIGNDINDIETKKQ